MKLVLCLIVAFYSLSALAFMNEVECESYHDGKIISLEVERPYSPNSPFRRLEVQVRENNTVQTFSYSVTLRRFGFNEIQYFGGVVNLVIDLWPDNFPRWGNLYRATFQNRDWSNQNYSDFDCRFPYAQ